MSTGAPIAIAGALLVLAMASTRRRASAPVLGTGRTDLERLQHRLATPAIREAAARWRDRFFPGVPLSAMLAAGITSTSSVERGGPPDYATGLYGVELERASRWADDAQTLRELGRAYRTDADHFGADIEAQTYAGFRSYREHCDTVARSLPAELRPAEGSVWLWRLAVSAYSSGDGAVSRVVRGAAALDVEGAPDLAAAPHRWTALGRAVLAAHAAGRRYLGGIALRGKWRAAYLVLRCERRFRAGLALASAAPELAAERAWYAGDELPANTASALEPIAAGGA